MSQNPSPPSLDRTERAGSPGLVLALAGFLVAVMAAFSFMPHDQANRLILVLLAALAFIGISGLLAYAVGFVQISGAQARNDLTKIIVDTSSDGMVVTEGESRIVYANEAYMALAGAADAAGLRTGRPAVFRRAGSVGADLPAGAGGARRQARRRGIAPHPAPARRRRLRLVPHPRAADRTRRRPARRAVDHRRRHARARAP